METIRSNAITIIDNTTNQNIDLYLASNLPNVQIYKETTGQYIPSWEESALVIMPSVYVQNQPVAITSDSLQVVWKKKLGDGSYQALTDETVLNGALTVNKNILSAIESGIVTYGCTVTYNDITSVFSEVSFSLLTSGNAGGDGADAKYVTVHADGQVFVMASGTSEYVPSTITLTAELFGGLSGYQWSYYDGTEWVDIAGATGASYTVRPNNIDSRSMTYRCTSEDRYDIMTVSKLQDGATPVKGVDYFDGTDGKDGTPIVWRGSYMSSPNNPQDGWAYYNTTKKASYVYQDGAWYQMCIDGATGNDGLSIVWKGELSTPPSSPEKNWVYRDVDDGKVYIYDGTGWELMVTDGASGDNGVSLFVTYCDTDYEPDMPFGDGNEEPWHTDFTSNVIWMSQKVGTDITEGTWGSPVRIKGYDGKNGVSGTSNYFFIRYSANENGNPMTLLPKANTKYMGVATTTTSSAPSSYKSYTWSLIKGNDGTDGTPGEPGADGQTSYLHVKYSDDGSTFTENDGETIGMWIGTYVDFVQEDSTDFAIYNWAKFIGDDGADGKDGIDGVDAYTIALSNEFIPIPSASNFKPIDSETYTCEVSVYRGADKLLMDSYSIAIDPVSVLPGTCAIENSTLIVSVSNSVALDSNAGIIKLNITIGDRSFAKDVKWVAVKDGANGSGGITFRIYSQHGTVFTKDTPDIINLELLCFDGGVEIAEARWQWYKLIDGVWEKNWDVTNIGQAVTNTNTLPVYRSEVLGSQVYKCEMTYNNVRYTDVVTMTDKTDTYFSKIIPIGGSIIRSGEDGIIAYTSVFKGDEEIDPLLGPISESPPETGLFYYKTTKQYVHVKYSNDGTTFTDNDGYDVGSWYGTYTDEKTADSTEFADYTWTQISSDTVVPIPKAYRSITLMQSLDGVWTPATTNPHQYVYNWSDNATVENPSILNKVVYLSNDDISNGSIVQCTVSEVSVCQEVMLDVNDPILSSIEPSNPENGQLWLDTSTSPNILKVYNATNGEWNAVNAETQSRVFTSVPNVPFADGLCYRKNDLWIVSESDTGMYTSYPAGTLLVSTGSNLTFDTNNWINKLYYDQRIEMLENYDKQLRTYFDFQTDGLKIGRNIDGVNFYSKITPTDLGFYQGSDKIAYISNNKMYNTELEVQRSASVVSHQYMQNGVVVGSYETTFKIGTFQFLFESNGSLSISRIEHDAPKPYISSIEVNSSFTKITLYVKYWGPSSGSCGYTSSFESGRLKSDTLTFSSITQSNDTIILNVSFTPTAGTYDIQILAGMLVNTGTDSSKYTYNAVSNDAITLYIQK